MPRSHITPPSLRRELSARLSVERDFLYGVLAWGPPPISWDALTALDALAAESAPMIAYQAPSGAVFGLCHPDHAQTLLLGSCLALKSSDGARRVLVAGPGGAMLALALGPMSWPASAWRPESVLACSRLDLLLARHEREAISALLPGAAFSPLTPISL